jgi:acyl-coenzyme A thioesterase PaaI-like protein
MSEQDGTFERIRGSFAKQGIMGLLVAKVTEVGEGRCQIEVPYSEEITQQQRYFHGAVAGAIGDSAGGYAALTFALRPIHVGSQLPKHSPYASALYSTRKPLRSS